MSLGLSIRETFSLSETNSSIILSLIDMVLLTVQLSDEHFSTCFCHLVVTDLGLFFIILNL